MRNNLLACNVTVALLDREKQRSKGLTIDGLFEMAQAARIVPKS